MSDKWKFDSDENNDCNGGRKIETRHRSVSTNNKKHNRILNNSTSENFRNERSRNENRNKEPCNCIGIFGLSKMTNEKTLRNIFEKYGRIVSVKLIMDKNRNESLGFAFVKYEELEFASKAIEMANEMNVDGRTIRVDYSITQKAHTPTPGHYKGKISNRKNDTFDNKNNDSKYGQNLRDNFRRNSLENKRFRGKETNYSDRENLYHEKDHKYNVRNNRFDERNDRHNDGHKRYDNRISEYPDRNNRFNERDLRNCERNPQFDERERYNERSSRYDEVSKDRRFVNRNDVDDRDYSCNDRITGYFEKDHRINSKRSDPLKSRFNRVDSFDQNRYSEKRSFPRENNEKIYSSSGDRNRYSTNQRRSPDSSRVFRSREPRLNERSDREYNNQEINYSNERFRDKRERFENHSDRRRSRSPVRRESPSKKSCENFRSRKFI